MSVTIEAPFKQFTDADGKPLENGYIYIGTASLNPEQSPITVFWDAAQTIPASQPIRTIGGYPSRSGTPSRLYVGTLYSITVRDKNLAMVFNNPVSDITGISGGSTSGSGVKNYITEPDFESGTAAGWNLGRDFGTTFPTSGGIGGGATSFTSLTIDNANPLSGTGSLVINKPANDCTGSTMYSNNITLNREDIGTAMVLSFSYQTPVEYVSGDMGVYLWDVNGGFLIPGSVQEIPASYGAPAKHLTTFITTTNLVYRIIFMCRTTNASGMAIMLDSIVMTPYAAASGSAISEWQSYTPTFTGFGTVATSNMSWRRVGSSLQVSGRFVAGTTTAVEAQMTLPPGLTSSSSISTLELAGLVAYDAQASYERVALIEPSKSYFTFGYAGAVGGSLSKGNGSTMFPSNSNISFSATVPIAQWTSNINLATDFAEYAYNTQATINTNDTTSFGYGIGGTPIIANTAATYYDVQFQRPIQVGDDIRIEVMSVVDGSWVNVELAEVPSLFAKVGEAVIAYDSASWYRRGMAYAKTAANKVRVYFFQSLAGSASYSDGAAAATRSWASCTGAADGFSRWRVRKVSNGNMAEVPDSIKPIGEITMFGGSTAPSGWLLCDGSAVSRSTYGRLFGVISTTWGSGDGSTTFNLPDLREASPYGAGTRGSGVTAHDAATLGQFKDDQMQGHYHQTGYLSTGSGTALTNSSGNPNSGTFTNNSTQQARDAYTDGTNGTPRVGSTTRGKIIGVNFIIRWA